jgi:hypothetical protein
MGCLASSRLVAVSGVPPARSVDLKSIRMQVVDNFTDGSADPLDLGPLTDGERIRGTAVAHAIVATAVAVPLALAALRRIGVPLLPIARTLIGPLLGTAVGAACCAIVAHLTTGSDLVQLVTAGPVGLLMYVVIVLPSEGRRRWSVYALGLVPATAQPRSACHLHRLARNDPPGGPQLRATHADRHALSTDAEPSSPPPEDNGERAGQHLGAWE